jgi:hypothetical protein
MFTGQRERERQTERERKREGERERERERERELQARPSRKCRHSLIQSVSMRDNIIYFCKVLPLVTGSVNEMFHLTNFLGHPSPKPLPSLKHFSSY